MRRHLFGFASALGCLLAGAPGCGPVDVVVAEVSDGGMARDPHGPPCTKPQDCPQDSFCERPSCGAIAGRCMHRAMPLLCPDTAQLECGCDGVTYFNECLRRAAGVSLEATGECGAGAACDTAACPGTAFCARLATSCGSVVGRCWMTPPRCPTVGGWAACGSDGGVCLDLCEAVRSQQPVVAVSTVCR